MKFTFKLVFTLALTVLLIAFVAVSTTFNSQARMMPLIIGIPVLLLALGQLLVEVREAMQGQDESQVPAKPAAPGHRHTLAIYAWIAAVFGALYLVGFVVTAFFYPLLYMRFVGHRSWRLSAGISLGAVAFVYVVMIMGLQVNLYDGVVVLALRKAFAGY